MQEGSGESMDNEPQKVNLKKLRWILLSLFVVLVVSCTALIVVSKKESQALLDEDLTHRTVSESPRTTFDPGSSAQEVVLDRYPYETCKEHIVPEYDRYDCRITYGVFTSYSDQPTDDNRYSSCEVEITFDSYPASRKDALVFDVKGKAYSAFSEESCREMASVHLNTPYRMALGYQNQRDILNEAGDETGEEQPVFRLIGAKPIEPTALTFPLNSFIP